MDTKTEGTKGMIPSREEFMKLSDAILEGKDLTPFIPFMEWIRERMKEVKY